MRALLLDQPSRVEDWGGSGPRVCGCPLCGGEGGATLYDGEGLSGLDGTKPVWSLPQIVDNLTRWDARWAP